MKIKTLIVDDEELAREGIKQLLASNDDIEIIGEAENGLDAVQQIEDKNPDLVILDIQMPGMIGFEVVSMLKNPPLIIFSTAYDQYAIQAFEVHSLDYLLKPISQERMDKAIERAKKFLEKEQNFEVKIKELLNTLKPEKNYLIKIPVREKDKIILLDPKEVLWIEAKDTFVYVHTSDQKHLTNYTLHELENKLDPSTFFRAHRSTIVNLNHISEIVPWFSGSCLIRLKNKTEVTLSRRQARKLKEIFSW